ncbi:MAG: TolC family protein [Nitrospiraceae bacterium]|nr:TolC family protein [Nitrospiraceae bacterium]
MNGKLLWLALLAAAVIISQAIGAAATGQAQPVPPESAPAVRLQALVDEALANNPGVASSGLLVSARRHRIPQAKSLPDPMVSFGYQNEGWDRYSWGDRQMAQWMFGASQKFPFPGKLGLQGKIANEDALSAEQSYEDIKLQITRRVKDLYYDLLLNYKGLDIINQRYGLFTELERAALARYSAGLAPQEEVILAQTEKYTLLEKKQEITQKITADNAMLASVLGRSGTGVSIGRPEETVYFLNAATAAPLVNAAVSNSPRIKALQRMVDKAGAEVAFAKKQYYPDFTVAGQVDKKAGAYMDDWSLVTSVNIPLYYKTKQREAVEEAGSLLAKAKEDLQAGKLSISSDIENYFSVAGSSKNLMQLYKDGLVPKTYQDFESALSGYTAGTVSALTAINRLKALLDYEFKYWQQFTERQKAIAGIEALTGRTSYITEGGANGNQ